MRQRPILFLCAAGTLALGLAVRFAHLGLPPWATKYGGSFLWALMVYWIVAGLLWPRSPRTAGVAAWVLTTAVECFKLVHTPALDRFRLTLAGILLLGRFFSVLDLCAYALALGLGVALDSLLRRRL